MNKEFHITPRNLSFSDWYQDIVVKAGLADYSGVKGCMVIKPHGYAIWELMQRALDTMFKETGHENAYFPLFVPKSFFAKEAEHVSGFAKECAVVTHYRLKEDPETKELIVDPEAKLEEELIIRPTSETVIWNMYSKWIQSYRDLPILINQWANVVRWEMRTRLFLRTAEFLWQEGHTAHETYEEAEREALTILDIYRKFAEEWMAVPVIAGRKTDSEKFAGADHTYTIEALTQDLRCLQAGTSHHLGQNFAKAFNVQFATREGSLEYVYATSWGVSTRLIGTLVMVHSDDKGLVCPPRLAPLQVIFVPIWGGDERVREKVFQASDGFSEILRKAGWDGSPIRCKVDKREKETPGFKFNDWEMRGACLRIELGPRDLQSEQCVVARRDTGIKINVPFEKLVTSVQQLLDDMQHDLLVKARNFRDENTHRLDSYEEFKKVFDGEGGPGFVLAHWDGTEETEKRISEETKATIRCIPLEPLDSSDETPGRCIVTGKPSKRRVVFGKAY